MFKKIDHVELVPKDADTTIRFYTDVLDFRETSRHKIDMPPLKEVIYLRLGDTVMEIVSIDQPKPRPQTPWQTGYHAIALEVEDMTQAVEYLKTRGIHPSRQPVDLGDSFRAEIQDPDGLTIELRQWKRANR